MIILVMKYMNLIDNFVMIAKSNECRCSSINLINLDFSQLYYCYDFVNKLYTLINLEILINENYVLLYCLTECLVI
jgi:hypothetical protein